MAADFRAQALASFEKAIEEVKNLDNEVQHYMQENSTLEAEIRVRCQLSALQDRQERIQEREQGLRAIHSELVKHQSELRVRDQVVKAHEEISARLHEEIRALDRALDQERQGVSEEKELYIQTADQMAEKANRVKINLHYLAAQIT